ncbi:O-antigen ligase family protein [Terricaulis silvestris]|uniref:Putative O-glycosylation ligase, exosortase A-associated n=1 Tax=Terricaulis silvestris TaxID=2686094 RepID=A0A6I6MFT7_9CAUL|nr:O-antigen ligase family protein [Terricaulis silvestris]QGZ93370.1 putative O-glycosylation ligase, exosortase A-associated [Terricaulis silvestris]
MTSIVRLASNANPICGATLVIILAAMVVEGANTPAAAALLSGALLATLFVSILTLPSSVMGQILASNRVPAAAATAFVVLAALSAAPLQSPDLAARFAHPLAPAFQWLRPSMSLAPTNTIEGLIAFLGPLTAFVLGALASLRHSRSVVSAWLCALTVVYALYALSQYFAGQADARLDAHIGSANAAAALFGALAIFACARVIGKAGPRNGPERAPRHMPRALNWVAASLRAPLATAAFALAVACALLTASRGGLAATGIGFGAFVGLLALRASGARRTLILAPALALGALGLWFIAMGADPVLGRFGDVGAALEGRQELLAPHWQAFLSRPLLGHGLNTFHDLNAMAITPDNWDSLRIVGAAHNIYVQALEETGVIGLALFVLMVAPPLWRALESAVMDKSAPHWSAALYGASLLFLVHGVMDFTLQIPAIAALFAFCLGAFSNPAVRQHRQQNGSF